jgi:hypothetical protein
MSMPLTINHIDFMEVLKNYDSTFNATSIRTYSEPTSNGIFVKVGRTFGKASRFFKKSETKISALISLWSVETLIFISLSINVLSVPMIMLLTGWYLFETYAIFSAIIALASY